MEILYALNALLALLTDPEKNLEVVIARLICDLIPSRNNHGRSRIAVK